MESRAQGLIPVPAMNRRSQGALEYLLMLSGVLLIAVLVIILVRSNALAGVQKIVESNFGAWLGVANASTTAFP